MGETVTRQVEPIGTATLWDAAEHAHGPWTLGERRIEGLIALREGDIAFGPAYTIRLRRAREMQDDQRLAFLGAIDEAPTGAMVAIEVATDIGGAAMGDLVGSRLKQRGVAGILVEGPVRDRLALARIAPPVWFRRSVIAGLVSRQVVVEIGVDVCIAGAVVRPGDYLAADIDGALVIPPDEAERTLATARRLMAGEQAITEALAGGRSLRDVLVKGEH